MLPVDAALFEDVEHRPDRARRHLRAREAARARQERDGPQTSSSSGSLPPLLLFLATKHAFETFTDRHFSDLYESVLGRTGGGWDVARWGPGYAGWDETIPDHGAFFW